MFDLSDVGTKLDADVSHFCACPSAYKGVLWGGPHVVSSCIGHAVIDNIQMRSKQMLPSNPVESNQYFTTYNNTHCRASPHSARREVCTRALYFPTAKSREIFIVTGFVHCILPPTAYQPHRVAVYGTVLYRYSLKGTVLLQTDLHLNVALHCTVLHRPYLYNRDINANLDCQVGYSQQMPLRERAWFDQVNFIFKVTYLNYADCCKQIFRREHPNMLLK